MQAVQGNLISLELYWYWSLNIESEWFLMDGKTNLILYHRYDKDLKTRFKSVWNDEN